jgi:regulator of protease activity HflC (stomatin/prohibitin superfamily)
VPVRPQIQEQRAAYLPGVWLLVGGVTLVIVAIVVFSLRGLTAVKPGHAHVVQLFGRYTGTIREPGLQWVNPFSIRIPVSTRIRNTESALVKVNDADGNPIEIAAVIVWQVADTAHAVYSVDDYARFVAIQSETAVRHIASKYPYDSRGADILSLRENAEEITGQLAAEAGARQRIVEGAVGMVQLALRRLDEENVVELDEERKAAMVSNLLVVLCSEQATQQVVNTGSLYQ